MGAFSRRQGLATDTPEAPDAGFAEPPVAYGPHAFWFWNHPCELADPAHFARMAAAMAAQGLNPGYAHARFWHPDVAFWQTPAWHACFQAAVEATAASGARLGWTMGDPSFPDKYILPDHPELKAVSLAWATRSIPGGTTAEMPTSLFSVAARRDDAGAILSASLVVVEGSAWAAPSGADWTLWSFTPSHAVHPGGTAINVLDRRTTGPWLALEHDRYAAACGRHLGATIDCVFFDHEGSYGCKLAWSDDLARTYRDATGTDIRRWMPLMLEEDAEGRWAKARHDWFDAIGRTYRACLLEPLDAWCRERGMAVTCHLWEERLTAQALQTGGFMAAQRAYSMPGTDALFDEILHPRIFKETQSVCEFEGRPCMCEALGIAGWHLTPTQMKRAANAGVAWGITRFVPHGVNSHRDLAAVSYPPDFFDWNPYWRHFHRWSGFVRRASFVNDHGRLDARTLLFCPLDSVCALLGDGIFDPARPHDSYLIQGRHDGDARHAPTIAAIEAGYSAAMVDLTSAGVEFLVADRHYLERMRPAGDQLILGGFSFTTLVLPPLKLLSLLCAERIVALAEAGGHVIGLGSLPDASAEHGVGDPALAALMARLRAAPGFTTAADGLPPLCRAQAAGLQPNLIIESGGSPLITSRRRIGDRLFLWIANNGDDRLDTVMRIPDARGRAMSWDCEGGSMTAMASEDLPEGCCRIPASIAPNEGFWLVVDPSLPPASPRPAASGGPVITIEGPWRVLIDAADQPDPAQHRLDAPLPLLGGGSSLALASWTDWGLRHFTGFVDYHREVLCPAPRGDEVLDLGVVRHLAEVWVNGNHLGARLWAPYEFPIGAHLRPGANQLRVRVGNLILNAVTQYPGYPWKWHGAPSEAQLSAGLMGPVAIRPPSGASPSSPAASAHGA